MATLLSKLLAAQPLFQLHAPLCLRNNPLSPISAAHMQSTTAGSNCCQVMRRESVELCPQEEGLGPPDIPFCHLCLPGRLLVNPKSR